MEIIGAFANPGDECREPGVRLERLDRAVAAGELRLRQGGVDLVVADLMQAHRGAALAAPQAWDEVMEALFRLRRDRATAEGADREFVHGACRSGRR